MSIHSSFSQVHTVPVCFLKIAISPIMETSRIFSDIDISETSSSELSCEDLYSLTRKKCQGRRTDVLELRTRTRLLQQRMKCLESKRRALKKKDAVLKQRQHLLQQQLIEVMNSSLEKTNTTCYFRDSTSCEEADLESSQSSQPLLSPETWTKDLKLTSVHSDDSNNFRRFSPRRCSFIKQHSKTAIRVSYTPNASNHFTASKDVVHTQPICRKNDLMIHGRTSASKGLKRLFKKTFQCAWC